jgi:hypothetical protein
MADENVNNAVDELLQQLQTGNTPKPAVVSQEMSKEDIEKFLLQHSSQLIKGTVEFVEDLKKYIISAPTAEDVTAMATLVNSSAAAIETLNKVLLTNKNIDAKFKLKQMDIDSKKEMQQVDIQGKLVMNREELLKKLLDDSKIINVEVTDAQAPKTSLEDKAK